MEISVLLLFIFLGVIVIGGCIISILSFMGVKSIKNDLDALKKKTALLETASGVGEVSQILGYIETQKLRIDDLVPQVNELKANVENIQNQSAEGSDVNNQKINDLETSLENLQDQIGSGVSNVNSQKIDQLETALESLQGLSDHITVTTNVSHPNELVFSTQGIARWKISHDGHLLPIVHELYDFGNADNKVRHLFLSDNTIYTNGGQLKIGKWENDGIPIESKTILDIETLKVLVNESTDFDGFKNGLNNQNENNPPIIGN